MRRRDLKTFGAAIAGMIIGASAISAFSVKETAEQVERIVVKVIPFEAKHHGKLEYKWESPELPQQVVFAGEQIAMDVPGRKEQVDKQLMSNYNNQRNTALTLKMANRWFPVIEPILAAHGVPDDLKYLCVAESALRNEASGNSAGFWGFVSRTASSLGLEVRDEVDERLNVAKSTEAAAKYLKQAYAKSGSWSEAAAAYGGKNTSFNRVLAFKLLVSNPDQYGFQLNKDDVYEPIATRKVTVRGTIKNLAEFAVKHGTNLKTLKELNPWLRAKTLTVAKGKSYEIALPVA